MPAAMREWVFFIRQWGPGADAGGGRASFARRHRETWLIAIGGAILLAGVGAFGTDHAAPFTLYSYWFGMMLVSGFVLAAIKERLTAWPGLTALPLLRSSALVIGTALAMTPIVWVVAARVLDGSTDPAKMVALFPQAMLIAAAFVSVQWAVSRRVAAAPFETSVDMPPPILNRLPASLSGANLQAIEAQDHYLRLHTDRGTALVLMRLSDAIEETAGLEGARTHRSWWVARTSVLDVERGRGRATLTLNGGVRVPVSRTHSPVLRRAGWY